MAQQLRISLLGPFHVERNGEVITQFEYDKVRALLAYLCVEKDLPHRRDTLTGLLWPDQSDQAARHSLSQALLKLRQALGDQGADSPVVLADRTTMQLNSQAGCWLDITEFQVHLDACARHEHAHPELCPQCAAWRQQAVALYRGEFLQGLSVDSAEFEVWMVVQRERLHRLVMDALYELTRYHEWRGELGQALQYARRQVDLEPWREEAHQQLMRLLAHSGQRSAALAQYEICCRALGQGLGVEPSDQTVSLYEHIRRSKEQHRQKLPAQPTPFVGRQEELAATVGMLAHPECRLLTFVAAGGMGKTRLALQVAERTAESFLDGVYFVPLAGVESVDQLVTTIADAIGFSFYSPRDLQSQLLRYLSQKEILLVLDNFEHLLDGVDLVVEILNKAPGAKILITSRTRLNLPWEWVFTLEGLAVPAAEERDDIEHYSAVQLFLQRAQQVRHDFFLTASTASDIVQVCQLVEGMPLAIELAATWVRALSCRDIVAEIQQGLDLLTSAAPAVLPWHRNIRTMFERSWLQLSTKEQTVFRNLSIFPAGFSKDAAESVAGASLPLLTALVDKCLVRAHQMGRYSMHELLRQYAKEKLDEAPQEYARLVEEQYGHYYAEFLQKLDGPLSSSEQGDALEKIEQEIENIRAAWRWAVAHAEIKMLEQSHSSLGRFYFLRSLVQEGAVEFEKAIVQVQNVVDAAEALDQSVQSLLAKLVTQWAHLLMHSARYEQAITAARQAISLGEALQETNIIAEGYHLWGASLWCQGSYEGARARLERALTLAQTLQLRQVEAESLFMLGNVAGDIGNFPQDREYYEQGLHIYREIDDKAGEAKTLGNLGVFASEQGDYVRSKEYYEQELYIGRQIGNQPSESHALHGLSAVFTHLGSYASAKAYAEQALQISREINDLRLERAALAELGLANHYLGDQMTARQQFQQALTIARTIGDRRGQGAILTNIGNVLASLGKFVEATNTYRQALDLRRELAEHHLAMEPLAGLASVSLMQGNLAQAQTQVADIMNYLETNAELTGTDDLQIYLTCYRVLHACQDSRAGTILSTAYRLLQERADKIDDEQLRHSFLENIAVHQEISEAYGLDRE